MISLQGVESNATYLPQAARAANLNEQARYHYRELLEVSSRKDSRRPALKEAQEFVRK